MNRYGLPIFVILLVVAVNLWLQNNQQPTSSSTFLPNETLEVIRVIDGDTLVVKTATGTDRVRLLGVDAAEFDLADQTQSDCYASEAKGYLSELVLNHEVLLEADPINENRDEYGRLLRYVYTKDKILVNQILIATGHTKFLSYFPISKWAEFAAAEESAQSEGLGLWSECGG